MLIGKWTIMNTMKSFRESLKTHVWNVISPWLWGIFAVAFVLTILTMFSDIMTWFDGKTDTLLIGDILQFLLFLILTEIIFIITMYNVYFDDVLKQKEGVLFKLMIIACGALAFMLMIFIWIMFSEYMLKLVGGWLGADGKKSETLSSIGYGMGGALAVIGAIAINRRANAEVENNRLIEKGHIDERLKSAIENLGRENSASRISSFYQFYYLAKGQQDTEFKKSIFEILCAHLRNMTQEKSYQEKIGKDTPTVECKILLTILFRSKKETAFGKDFFKLADVYLKDADLRGVNLKGADLSDANLTNAKFRDADLSYAVLPDAILTGANFESAKLHHTTLTNANLEKAIFIKADLYDSRLENARSIKGADFRWATINGEPISQQDLPDDKGE